MSPPNTGRKGPPEFEPRRGLDRRIGERRQRVELVARDRRRSADRRRLPDRREGALGHLRNAIQLLELVGTGMLTGDETRAAARAAAARLWLAVDELERLQLTRSILGHKVRLEDIEFQIRETSA